MPAKYPVIGLDPWRSEPESVDRQARRDFRRFLLRNFLQGVCLGILVAAAIALLLRLFGILP